MYCIVRLWPAILMLFEVHSKNVSDISEDQSSSGQDVSYQGRILGQKLPSWAKVAKLGKSCKVGQKLQSWGKIAKLSVLLQ